MKRIKNTDLEIKNKKNIFKGFNKIDEYIFRYKCLSNKWSKKLHREIYTPKNAVALLPFDPKSNKVLLIKQFRIGAYVSGFNPWQIEIIAGCIDKSDLSIENAILRETKEESGLIINKKNLILVHKILNSPGTTSEKTYIFFCECDLNNAGGVFGCQNENEEIENITYDVSIAFDMLDNDKINSVHSIVALNWLRNYLKKRNENKNL